MRRRAAELNSAFPGLWQHMVDEWADTESGARAWLMYSASYLMRTGDVRWAIDPVRLEHRLPSAPAVDYPGDLTPLSFILLTHQHGDHLDLKLVHSLRRLPITWVVPEPLVRRVIDVALIPAKQVIVPKASVPIDLQDVRITPFDGMHWEKFAESPGAADRGVPAVGYLVEFAAKRWLFPGDTRTYDARALPSFAPVDILFAHIWLGRAAALANPPPLLESFCQWCIDLQPRRVVLTHLEEFGRGADDFWDAGHGAQVTSRLKELQPTIDVVSPAIFQSIGLYQRGI